MYFMPPRDNANCLWDDSLRCDYRMIIGKTMAQQRIGVIGGGQLAWMMGLEAPKLGVEIVVQTPQKTDPAVPTAADCVLAAVADAAGTKALSDRCDVLTFENEFVDLSALSAVGN
jgi:5-(carboxyamino)imidazole ribonucleotide synthase